MNKTHPILCLCGITYFDFESPVALRDEIVGDGWFLAFFGHPDR